MINLVKYEQLDLIPLMPYWTTVTQDGGCIEFYFPVGVIDFSTAVDNERLKRLVKKIEVTFHRENRGGVDWGCGYFTPPEKILVGHTVSLTLYEKDRPYCLSLFSNK